MPDAPSGSSSLHGIAAALPRFPGGAPPAPETMGRKRLIRVVSTIAVLGTLAYLGDREKVSAAKLERALKRTLAE